MGHHHAWWWPVPKAHSKPAGAGAAGGLQAEATEGTHRAAPNTVHIDFSEGVGDTPEAGARFWGCAKGPGEPTLQGCLYGPQARNGLQRPSTHLLRVRLASGPLPPCSAGFPPPPYCIALPPTPREPPGPVGREDVGVPGALSTWVTPGATPETGGDVRARVKGLWPHQPER